MRAIITKRYGGPEVLSLETRPRPTLKPDEVLVEVHATVITDGDRRMRAADFPGVTALFGRLMFGLRRPRLEVQGSMFAGRVVEVGAEVERFAVGDDVFGESAAGLGANAEYLAARADGPLCHLPEGISYEEAAATPYGAGTALHFLEAKAKLQPGERALIVGASGGVGRFAVQLAKEMGAHVTGVCSARHHDLVRRLGADEVIDYHAEDFTTSERRWDVILDIADASSFRRARRVMTPEGRYLSLFISLQLFWWMAWTALRGGQRAGTSVALASREGLERLAGLLRRRVITPVVGPRFPLAEIAEAHAAADAKAEASCVVVRVAA